MELELSLKNIFSQFKVESSFKSFQTFSSGHINDTYLIITNTKPYYILQKLNGNVFKKAVEVIENKTKVASFLEQREVKTIQFIQTKNNRKYYKDDEGNFWNLSKYIEDSETFLQVTSTKIAFESGKITGEFLSETNRFKGELVDVLPDFHSMSFRFQQFEESLLNGNQIRKKESKEWIDFIFSVKEEMFVLEKAIQKKEIPLRVTHNDTKISNILFDKKQIAICLIDLDTVMLGTIHFDYGDALRTICSTALEDEANLNEIDFNIEYFKNYTQGFLSTIKDNISKEELNYLPISIKIMTFIMGLRFFTDYLNDDVYYKANYKNHNLDRAKNQFTLVKRIKENQQEITDFIRKESSFLGLK